MGQCALVTLIGEYVVSAESYRTAIARKGPSLPVQRVVKLLPAGCSVLDFGCGRGKDVEFLRKQGFDAVGYDPNPKCGFTTKPENHTFDVVLCTYVLNTLREAERADVIREAVYYMKKSSSSLLYFFVRAAREVNAAAKGKWQKVDDGHLTGKGTFQRGFTDKSLYLTLRKAYVPGTVIFLNPVHGLSRTSVVAACLSFL